MKLKHYLVLAVLVLLPLSIAVTYRVDAEGGPDDLAAAVAAAFATWEELETTPLPEPDEATDEVTDGETDDVNPEDPPQDATGEDVAPAEETPLDETPTEEIPAEEPSGEEPLEEVAPEEAPADDTSPEETPSEEAPSEETTPEEAPPEDSPEAPPTEDNPDSEGAANVSLVKTSALSQVQTDEPDEPPAPEQPAPEHLNNLHPKHSQTRQSPPSQPNLSLTRLNLPLIPKLRLKVSLLRRTRAPPPQVTKHPSLPNPSGPRSPITNCSPVMTSALRILYSATATRTFTVRTLFPSPLSKSPSRSTPA